jgi:DNA-binding response OmpR family regulator
MAHNNKEILIVDDEQKVGFFLSQSLTRMSDRYDVKTARSGEEALDILENDSIDLLITDLRMPGISGLDLIQWVRASSPETRVVLITAYGSEEIQARARQLDVYRYLRKPFTVKDFTGVVQGALSEGASSAGGVLAFSEQVFEAITQRLDALRQDINAQCIYLADMQGQRLATLGDTDDLNDTLLLTLLAGGFATSAELARQFGSGESANLNFHESSNYDIYSANVGNDLIIAIVYDRSVQSSRIGMVWLYTRRAIDDLSALIADDTGSTDSGTTLDENFGNSLMAEFDAFFSGERQHDDVNARPEPDESDGALDPRPDASNAQALPPSDASEHRRRDAKKRASREEPGDDLFSLEEAVEQGLIPPDLLNK